MTFGRAVYASEMVKEAKTSVWGHRTKWKNVFNSIPVVSLASCIANKPCARQHMLSASYPATTKIPLQSSTPTDTVSLCCEGWFTSATCLRSQMGYLRCTVLDTFGKNDSSLHILSVRCIPGTIQSASYIFTHLIFNPIM